MLTAVLARSGLSAIVVCALAQAQPGTAAQVPQPTSRTTGFNRHVARFTPLLELDFENPGLVPGGTLTASAIVGNSSLLVKAGSRWEIPPEWLPLQDGRTYVIEYDYKLPAGLKPSSRLGEAGGLMLNPSGRPGIALGRSPGDLFEASGTIRTAIRLESKNSTFAFVGAAADIVVDNVRIYRHDVDVLRAHVPFWRTGFPRLGNYSLTNPAEVSVRSGMPATEVERLLAMYDFVTGTDIDHTIGASGWVLGVRRINPDIRLLPYHNSFAASFSGTPTLLPGTGLQNQFINGLAEEWFATTPDGRKLSEPDYPFIFQMNHTRYSPIVDGRNFVGYTVDYLGDTVLASGLWDGIHFDQPEWYPNPLLIPRDFPADTPLPPMDLNRDGRADATEDLHRLWLQGYQDYFRAVGDKFGFAHLIFGNAGYIPSNTTVLPALNGFMREAFSPFRILPNGEWDTDSTSGWHRIYQNYSIADAVTRAPQMVSLEFIGSGLGTMTGTITPNGLLDRTTEVVARDYRRMRLGLTTTLLGNGFFEYDLTDNTTAPLWFDEFAVDSTGAAVQSVAAKGYLRQPLGVPQELSNPGRVVLWADFESAGLPASIITSPAARMSNQPLEVIEGSRSLVATRTPSDTNGIILATDPATIELIPGKTYQLLVDYRVLDYRPQRFQGLVAVSFQPPRGSATLEQAGSLFQPDVSGVGQSGTLRAVVKIPARGYRALVSILDNATIVFDSIRLVESAGGVFRRDFENGIVIVNPSPDPLAVTLPQIAGPLKRTGIRRIRGTQLPEWNNGLPVTGTIWLPPADGIVLLADRIVAAAPEAPRNLELEAGAPPRLTWKPVDQYVAGYLIRYGNDPGGLTREAATGRVASLPISQLDLKPGWTFFARVAAVDFLGNIGPFSQPVMALAPGIRDASTPMFSLSAATPQLAPGGTAVLVGSDLTGEIGERHGALPTRSGGTEVTVNGVPAPLVYLSPRRIEFLVPWEIAGEDAIIRVTAGSSTSADVLAPVQPAWPFIRTALSTADAIDLTGENLGVLQPGAQVELTAYGLGRIAGAPRNGALPETDWEAQVVAPVGATIDNASVEVISARASMQEAGIYLVTVRIPDTLQAGSHTVRLKSGDAYSNEARITVAAEGAK